MNAFYTNDTPFSSYGASGARLVVKGQVLVTSEDDVQNKKLPDDFVGRGAAVIRADGDSNQDCENGNSISSRKNDFTYSTMQGSKTMEFAAGGWTLKVCRNSGILLLCPFQRLNSLAIFEDTVLNSSFSFFLVVFC